MPVIDGKFPIYQLFKWILQFGIIIFPLMFTPAMYGASAETPPDEIPLSNEIMYDSEQLREKEPALVSAIFGMPLDQMMHVKVAVASLFTEENLVAGSSVSVIRSKKWKRMGARRFHEVLNNEPGVMTYPYFDHYTVAIRGYTNPYSDKGISILLDDIPLNDLPQGTALTQLQNQEIGTLDKVELIKGPGSAIYGSDAFHGVLSMTSFESDKDICMVEGAGGYPLYGDTNIKMSKGSDKNRIRINATASISGQDDLDMAYNFNDNGVTGSGTRKYQYDSKAGILKIRSSPNKKINIKTGIYITSYVSDDFPGLGSKTPGIQDKDLFSSDTRFCMGTGGISYVLDSDISVETEGYYQESRVDYDMFVSQNLYRKGQTRRSRSGAKFILKQSENSLNIEWFTGYSYDRLKINSESGEIKTETGLIVMDNEEMPYSGWSREVSSLFGQIKWGVADDRMFFLFGGRMDAYINYTTQFTPRCGLIYLPTVNSSVKALYGRAFMAPTAVNYFGYEGLLLGNPDLKPEIIDVYELIYMYRTPNWRLTLNSFYSLWQDGIIATYDPVADVISQTNEGKNTSVGGEMSLLYANAPFAVELGLSYVHSKAVDSINLTTLEKEDMIYAAFPEYSINLGLYYTLRPVNIDFYINNRVYLHMEASPDNNDPNPDSLDEYYRMDCNISKKLTGKWEAILDIRDVLNRKNRIPGIYPNLNGYEEPGRSILLRVTYIFL